MSGVEKLYKYCKIYSGLNPRLIEEDIFKIVIPLTVQATVQATVQDERVKKIVEFCEVPKNRGEIQKFIKINNRDYFRKEILNPLLEQGLLHPTIPDKLTSPKQKYYSGKQKDENG